MTQNFSEGGFFGVNFGWIRHIWENFWESVNQFFLFLRLHTLDAQNWIPEYFAASSAENNNQNRKKGQLGKNKIITNANN